MRAIQLMSALAQATRLEVLTHLSRALPDGQSAGVLAELTGTPTSTMSAHLTILAQAGLVGQTRSGRHIIYHAMPDAVRDLTRFLLRDCCPAAN